MIGTAQEGSDHELLAELGEGADRRMEQVAASAWVRALERDGAASPLRKGWMKVEREERLDRRLRREFLPEGS